MADALWRSFAEVVAIRGGRKRCCDGAWRWPARRWRRRLPWRVEGKLGLGFHV
ncbi:hypothetical protein DEO72_LG10g2379 [Vigna unguiculata]|uniref:Uncharacterized protein n=1 Tax=Vigna unguiculata TaxID=3917 RepID=A0A4D6NBS2_VIGUN|nr:hypothetical protein DEO72_LG10g2379 [Vigna unguiculata]